MFIIINAKLVNIFSRPYKSKISFVYSPIGGLNKRIFN